MRRTAPTPLAAAAAALALSACGYGFSERYVARGGAERVHVRAFENLSTEPELGVALTAALRTELARRGAATDEASGAVIEGDVRATEPAPSSMRTIPAPAAVAPGTTTVGTWRIALEVRARLIQGGQKVAERLVRRETVYLAGDDPLESEGRRALALRQLAQDAARDVLRAFER